jgi:hypothetical protein
MCWGRSARTVVHVPSLNSLPRQVRTGGQDLHDRADPLVPFIHAEWSQSCIPTSSMLTIHAGGHLIWIGQDSAFMHHSYRFRWRQR